MYQNNKNSPKTIVITRPLGDDEIIREELAERGYNVIHEPLTSIVMIHTARMEVENALLNEPNAVIVTSKHGAQALALLTEIRDMFLLCVGEATGNIAKQLGFDRVSITGETVEHLTDYILDCYDEEAEFLYISGEHVSADLDESLRTRGMRLERIVVYEAIASETLSDTLIEQIKRGYINAITFFSARNAQIFLSLSKKAEIIDKLQSIEVFCLSDNIAKTIENKLFNKIYISDKATLASMVNCIDNAYGNDKT